MSCSKENETNQNVSENAKVSTYLKSFYKTNYVLGKSVETKVNIENASLARTTELENYIITEVFIGDDIRARDYVITDKNNNDFLYFIDVDRVSLKLTSVKIDSSETMLFNNINEFDKYISTNKLDYIKIAEDLNNDPSLETGKFWGSQLSWGSCGPNTDGSAGCFRGEYSTYYVFWIGGKPRATGITEACTCP